MEFVSYCRAWDLLNLFLRQFVFTLFVFLYDLKVLDSQKAMLRAACSALDELHIQALVTDTSAQQWLSLG